MATYKFRKAPDGDWIITARISKGRDQPTKVKQVKVSRAGMGEGMTELTTWIEKERKQQGSG